jgi:CheY-like chemotaxis protein
MAKILLVEDDNNLREIYEARLQAEGYDIVSARDGEEALTVAMKERPDLIISDVMMPKISGFDMLDIIRSTEETKNAKVIMMTALSQAEDKERATKLGADRYLVKSQVTLEDVAKVAREVLNEASAEPAIAETPETILSPPAVVQTPVAPAPVVMTPSPPVVVDEPVTAIPVPEPTTVSTDSTATSTTSSVPAPASPALTAIAPATDDQSTAPLEQSVEDEQSAIAAQIESFIEVKKTENNTQSQAPVDQVAFEPDAPAVESRAEPENLVSQPTNTQPDSTPTTGAPETSNKRVIQPLTDLTESKGPDLDNLLKKEEEKEQMAEIAKAVATEKADVADELTAEATLRSASRNLENIGTVEANPSAPQVSITENGDLQVKEPPTEPQPSTSTAPVANEEKPIIPHTNGSNLDGVVAQTQNQSGTPPPAQTTPTSVDPDSIAL